ncbi:hypothetical protein AYI88_07550 [Shewanella algae]|nr:hypothetical protein AYI88_07550 [Shewanella algae]
MFFLAVSNAIAFFFAFKECTDADSRTLSEDSLFLFIVLCDIKLTTLILFTLKKRANYTQTIPAFNMLCMRFLNQRIIFSLA